MLYLLISITIVLIFFYFFRKNIKKTSRDDSSELFSTKKFTQKDNIKFAKCPQCGKESATYEEIKENFGLRKVGYTTDIQSWCRECRRNKEEIKKTESQNDNLNLFDE